MTNPEIDKFRNKRWYDEKRQLHREDEPAVEWHNGEKEWYLNGKRHRIGGPAVEWNDGRKEWWINDKRHREDGPAVEYACRAEDWYINDKKIYIEPILERLEISLDWRNWTDEEKFLVRLALP